MATCMFCGHAIQSMPILYTYLIPMGEDEPLHGSGLAHTACIQEFQRAQFDYDQMARDLISEWEKRLTLVYPN